MLKTSSITGVDKLKKEIKDLPLEGKIEVLTMLEDELFSCS